MPIRPPAAPDQPNPSRRQWLGHGAGLCLALSLCPAAAVSEVPSLQAMVNQWAGGRPVQAGRITLQVPELVEKNGNAVPLSVRVPEPGPGLHVQEIVVYNERNPQREVLRCSFGPLCPRAEAATRIRLATSQRLVALARLSDGSQWQHAVEVVVTLAACVES